MVKRNADGSLKVLGQMPDPDWMNQLRDSEEDVELEAEEEETDEDEG